MYRKNFISIIVTISLGIGIYIFLSISTAFSEEYEMKPAPEIVDGKAALRLCDGKLADYMDSKPVLISCGDVISISKNSIVLNVGKYGEETFMINENTKFYAKDKKKKVTLANIKIGQKATVVTKDNDNTAIEIRNEGVLKFMPRLF